MPLELIVYTDRMGEKNDLIILAARYTINIDILDNAVVYKPDSYEALLELASGLYLYKETGKVLQERENGNGN